MPNGVGARGRAFGLRNFEIAFPRTYRIENATGVAPSSEESTKTTIKRKWTNKKKNCPIKINFQENLKKLKFMVDKHNSQWYYN